MPLEREGGGGGVVAGWVRPIRKLLDIGVF